MRKLIRKHQKAGTIEIEPADLSLFTTTKNPRQHVNTQTKSKIQSKASNKSTNKQSNKKKDTSWKIGDGKSKNRNIHLSYYTSNPETIGTNARSQEEVEQQEQKLAEQHKQEKENSTLGKVKSALNTAVTSLALDEYGHPITQADGTLATRTSTPAQDIAMASMPIVIGSKTILNKNKKGGKL